MRKSSLFLLLLLVAAALLDAARLHAARRRWAGSFEIEARAAMVRRLGLTDLCLFTEARYARHPSQADAFTPFQDHPVSLEHFPSGSLTAPRRR
jgi:hypothetical protein